MGSQPTRSEIRRALDALGINVPFYRADGLPGGGIRFRLYGGRVVDYEPRGAGKKTTSPSRAAKAPAQPVAVDDLTAIPGVGKGTAGALKAAGLVNFEQLRGASDEVLLEVVNQSALAKIRAYLEEEHPQ